MKDWKKQIKKDKFIKEVVKKEDNKGVNDDGFEFGSLDNGNNKNDNNTTTTTTTSIKR